MKTALGLAFLSLMSYFAPLATLIGFILIFISLDLATGLYASWKTKVKIESHKLRKTVEKFVCYSLAIMVSFMFEQAYFDIYLTEIVAAFIASTELLSIYENIKCITKLDIATRVKDYISKFFPLLSRHIFIYA